MKTSVRIDLLYIRRHELGNRIFQFEMHSLPAFVMWDDKRSQVGKLRIDETLDTIGYGVVRVEDIKETIARRQGEIRSQ